MQTDIVTGYREMLCDVRQCSTSPLLYPNVSVTFGVYACKVNGDVSLAVRGTKKVNIPPRKKIFWL